MQGHALSTFALSLFVVASALGCTTERVVAREPARAVVVHEQAGPDRVVIVRKRPPRARREVQPRRPSRRHVWIGGHWRWHHRRYVWVAGRWVKPPNHGARWVAGRWAPRSGGWVWVAGYWRY